MGTIDKTYGRHSPSSSLPNSPINRRNQYHNPNIRRLHNGYDGRNLTTPNKKTRPFQSRTIDRMNSSLVTRPMTTMTTSSVFNQILLYDQKRRGQNLVKRYMDQETATPTLEMEGLPIREEESSREDLNKKSQLNITVNRAMTQELTPANSELPEEKPKPVKRKEILHKKAPRKEKTPNKRSSKKICILDREDCPPITEQDHLNGRCLCWQCTCGKHICPVKIGTDSRWSAAWSTSYNEMAKRRRSTPFDNEKIVEQQQIIHSPSPMIMDTTNRCHFKEFKIQDKDLRPVSQDRKSADFAFMGRTSYASDFSPTQTKPFVAVGRLYDTYRGNEVSMDMRTSYGSNFKYCASPTEKLDRGNQQRTTLSTGVDTLDFETTSKNTYGSQRQYLPTHKVTRSSEFVPHFSPTQQFTSINRREFMGQQNTFPVQRKQKIFTIN